MSWIDRINQAILRRIQPAETVLADETGIEQAGRRYSYSELHRAVAYRQPGVVGDALSVALDFGDGRIVVVSESDAAWRHILIALDRDTRVRHRSAEWSLCLVGGAPDARFELL